MLKKVVKYKNFNGEDDEDTFYFNLTKPELLELEVEYEGGLSGVIQQIIEAKDFKVILELFKKIISMSVGQKSADGKRFMKSPEYVREFEQMASYEVLFMEIATDVDAATAFLKGLLPEDMGNAVDDSNLVYRDPTATGS